MHDTLYFYTRQFELQLIEDSSIPSQIYRKPKEVNSYLPYESFHTISLWKHKLVGHF